MKRCELCDCLAKLYCESYEANHCWQCDTYVHSANLLAAKHSRTLLCHVCQSHTPWIGTGPLLGATLSVCNSCINNSSCTDGKGSENDQIANNDDEIIANMMKTMMVVKTAMKTMKKIK